jgi:hypothetical protein
MKKVYLIIISTLIFSAASAQQRRAVSITNKPVTDTTKYFSLRIVPSNYYSSNVGFFCRKELQVQNATKISVRFRLGSVAYCDAMEGKNNMHR